MTESEIERKDFEKVFDALKNLSVQLCEDEVSYEDFLRGIASFIVALIADNASGEIVFPSLIAHMNELFGIVSKVKVEADQKEKIADSPA